MGNILFGKSQRQNPTPSSVSDRIDLWSKIGGTLMPLVTAAPFIPRTISDIVVYILGALIVVLQVIKPYYGVKVVTEEVPAKNVEVIDDKPEKEN